MKNLINMMAQEDQEVFVEIDLDDDDTIEQIRCLVLAVWNDQGVVLFGGNMQQREALIRDYPRIMFLTQA